MLSVPFATPAGVKMSRNTGALPPVRAAAPLPMRSTTTLPGVSGVCAERTPAETRKASATRVTASMAAIFKPQMAERLRNWGFMFTGCQSVV